MEAVVKIKKNLIQLIFVDNDGSASLLPEDEDPLDQSSSTLKTTTTVNTEEEEHLDAVGGPLEVVVANPEKSQTPMESYITYEVKTETARLEYAASSLCIRRRFQDFIWLKVNFIKFTFFKTFFNFRKNWRRIIPAVSFRHSLQSST